MTEVIEISKLTGKPKRKKYGGRPKGGRNLPIRKIQQISDKAADRIAKKYGAGTLGKELPLDLLMRLMNDTDTEMSMRIDCAKTAIPYVHQRQPQMIEHSGKDGEAIEMNLRADDAHRSLERILFEESVILTIEENE